MPDAAPPVNRFRRSYSRSNLPPGVLTSSLRFRHFNSGSLAVLFCLPPDLVVARPFPSAFTTIAFGYSRRRWFETCSCKPVPRGLPSSVKQLRTTQRFLLSCSWHT